MKTTHLLPEKGVIIPSKLVSELREGNVIAWVGAGLSIGTGYPSWEQLVNKIAESICNTRFEHPDLHEWVKKNAEINPEWVAEVLFKANTREYYDSIKNEFNRIGNKESLVHALLSILPFRGYITTNYDTLIEHNLQFFTKYTPPIYGIKNMLELLTDNSNTKFVYKIHGDINSLENGIVLTETDYYSLQQDKIYNKILSWLFSKHTLVCFGYSLRDRDFRAILNDRYELLQGNCPPFYVFTSVENTCKDEIDCYKDKFNVYIVPINPKNNFEELSSMLLSLYCLCHRIESKSYSKAIIDLLNIKIKNQPLQKKLLNKNEQLKAYRILSAIKDPLEIDEIVSILYGAGITITSAHIGLLCKWVDHKKVICDGNSDKAEDRVILAKMLKRNLDLIPICDRFISGYHKKTLDKYCETLSYLLKHKESFNTLITTKDDFKRILEYYKQQGLWLRWLEIARFAQRFCSTYLEIDILQSIASVYFWTRDYNALRDLLTKYPQINGGQGANDYNLRLDYMTLEGLRKITASNNCMSSSKNINTYDVSLLGRAYARLSITDTAKRDEYLNIAENMLKDARLLAIQSNDMVEVAAQNVYLSFVLIDRGKLTKAESLLTETKYLDENIMEWKPGIAWLRVAEYRLALATGQEDVKTRRDIALKAMSELGLQRIDDYLDKEYYF